MYAPRNEFVLKKMGNVTIAPSPLQTSELPSCDQKWEWDFECGNVEATEGGEQTSWGSGGTVIPQRGTGGVPEQKICE